MDDPCPGSPDRTRGTGRSLQAGIFMPREGAAVVAPSSAWAAPAPRRVSGSRAAVMRLGIHTCFQTALASHREPAMPAYRGVEPLPWFARIARKASPTDPPPSSTRPVLATCADAASTRAAAAAPAVALLLSDKAGHRIRDEDMARSDANEHSTAGRAAGARGLPLGLREQPRDPMLDDAAGLDDLGKSRCRP
jgi:hypothetical protein